MVWRVVSAIPSAPAASNAPRGDHESGRERGAIRTLEALTVTTGRPRRQGVRLFCSRQRSHPRWDLCPSLMPLLLRVRGRPSASPRPAPRPSLRSGLGRGLCVLLFERRRLSMDRGIPQPQRGEDMPRKPLIDAAAADAPRMAARVWPLYPCRLTTEGDSLPFGAGGGCR